MAVEFKDSGWAFAMRQWHVVFLAGPRRRWWDWLCKPDFRHVLMFAWCDLAKVWVIVDSRQDGLRIRMLPDGNDFYLEKALWDHTGATYIRCDAESSTDIRHRLGFWCVPVVKNILGQGGGALRPEALYRNLLKSGAKPSAFGGDTHCEDQGA